MARKISKGKRTGRGGTKKPAIGNMPFANEGNRNERERAKKTARKAVTPPAAKTEEIKAKGKVKAQRRYAEDLAPPTLKIKSLSGPHRTGFISIAGRPNAGKSTLLNLVVGEKVAIVAPQAQTTRTSVQGILNLPNAQVIFTDTPGIHKSDTLFNKRMMDTVRGAVEDRDLVLYMVDATRPIEAEDVHAVSAVKRSAHAFLLLNKIDQLEDKRALLPAIEAYAKLHPFDEVFPICARTGQGVAAVMEAALAQLPEGESIFPEDQFTDQPLRFLAAELIRERVLRAASQEVPHAVAVLVDEWTEKPELTRIAATILVERPGQKAILIGTGGAMLKRIGSEARQEIEKLLDQKVFLSLYVKVQPKWREDPRFLQMIDWRAMVGSK